MLAKTTDKSQLNGSFHSSIIPAFRYVYCETMIDYSWDEMFSLLETVGGKTVFKPAICRSSIYYNQPCILNRPTWGSLRDWELYFWIFVVRENRQCVGLRSEDILRLSWAWSFLFIYPIIRNSESTINSKWSLGLQNLSFNSDSKALFIMVNMDEHQGLHLM